MSFPIPDKALAQHSAFLGKTGSGKTSTAKATVEHILRQQPSSRFCILDPIKSDWWGMTSSADGKRAGFPFYILGGPRGHVQLHQSAGAAIGELVGTGALPLSIIDMADFGPGGLQEFFNDFAPALMKKMRGVVYLILEEAHEFAPKERSNVGGESMAIYHAKKLATAGRSKGIRLMLVTQRTQALHNALLGSCDTMVAHRLTAPADQDPVKKWLKANVDKATFDKISGSMSSLKTGSAWLCSGEANIAELVQFPKITTFDNSATPDHNSDAIHVTTAPVDRDRLRSIIGTAVKDAEDNDPARLKAQIVTLQSQLASKSVTTITANDASAFEQIGWQKGFEAGNHDGFKAGFDEASRQGAGQFNDLVKEASEYVDTFARDFAQSFGWRTPTFAIEDKFTRPSVPPAVSKQPASVPMQRAAPPARNTTSPAAGGDGSLSGPQLTLLKSLAWWRRMGHENPTRPQVAAIAGWRVTAGHLRNVVGSLNAKGLTQASNGKLSLTAAGIAAAPEPNMAQTLHDGLRGVLTGPQQALFDALWKTKRKMSREDLANACGWDAKAGHLRNVIGSMRTLEIIDYPASGVVALQSWVTG